MIAALLLFVVYMLVVCAALVMLAGLATLVICVLVGAIDLVTEKRHSWRVAWRKHFPRRFL